MNAPALSSFRPRNGEGVALPPQRPRRRPRKTFISEAVGSFLDEYRTGSPKTLANYQEVLERRLSSWLESNGVTFLEDVEPAHLRAWLAAEAARYAPSTLFSRYNVTHRFFNWCVEQGTLLASPCSLVRRPRQPERTRVGFTRDEVKRLFQVIGYKDDPIVRARDRAILTLMLGTGCRADELLRLTPRHIEWGGKSAPARVLLNGKGGRDRWVPLGPKAARALADYQKVRPVVPFDTLWVTIRRTPFRYDSLNKLLGHLGEYAGVDECTPHRTRHTAASELYRATRDIMLVKSYLGHAKVETTLIYLRSIGVEYAQATYETPDAWLA